MDSTAIATRWFTRNIRLATHLALAGYWPEVEDRTFSYEERPPQEVIDQFLGGEDKTVNQVLDAYHTLRSLAR
jgi:hypothetical protein